MPCMDTADLRAVVLLSCDLFTLMRRAHHEEPVGGGHLARHLLDLRTAAVNTAARARANAPLIGAGAASEDRLTVLEGTLKTVNCNKRRDGKSGST